MPNPTPKATTPKMSTPTTTVQPSAAAAAFAIVKPVRATHGHRHRPWHYRADVGAPMSSTLCGALPLSDCIDIGGTDAFRVERPCTRCVAVVWALARSVS